MQDLTILAQALANSFAPAVRPRYSGPTETDKLRIVVSEVIKRRMEGLSLYVPLPIAEEFHRCSRKWRIVSGSNRCLAGSQLLHDPIDNTVRPIASISTATHVVSRDPTTGRLIRTKIGQPFVKGHGELYEVCLSSGDKISCTLEHRVLDIAGKWVSIGQAWKENRPLLCGRTSHESTQSANHGDSDSPCTSPEECHCTVVIIMSDGSTAITDGVLTFDESSHPAAFKITETDRFCSISAVRSIGNGLIWDISVPPHANYLAGGLVNANSGKTQAGAAEAVRAWCGADPYNKYVRSGGNAIVVGLDADHISMMWDKIGNPGAFKIIKDERTKLFRAVRYDPNNPTVLDPYDLAYQEKWKDAPPLLPHRMIDELAWEDRRRGIPRMLYLKNGWKVLFRSSEGKPPQGDRYDFAWIDEEIANIQFYYEILRGLTGISQAARHRPKAIWTATAQANNQELEHLRERALEGKANVAVFQFLIENNPYIPREEVEAFAEGLPEEERAVRIYGTDAMAGRRIYHCFDPQGIHGCEPFEIPSDWARYVYLDPGRQHCGTLFIAVDPDEKHRWVYDGFDLRNSNAWRWAEEVLARQNGIAFEAFVSDHRCGHQTHIGSNDTVAEVYWAAAEQLGLRPRTRGTVKGMAGFFPGSSSVMAREEALLNWMSIRQDGPFAGTPILKIFRGKIPLLERQIRYAAYELKKPDKRCKYREDLLVCLEYAAAHNPYYWRPEVPGVVHEDPMWAAWERKQERKKMEALERLYY